MPLANAMASNLGWKTYLEKMAVALGEACSVGEIYRP
jgi:hypothetical protein